MYGLQWISFYSHEWGDPTTIFTNDEVTIENHCRIASRVTKEAVFTVTHTLINFLYAISALIEHTNPLKHSSVAHFAIFTVDGLFWLGIVTSLKFNLWRHANARYLHCDIIFVDCSCTHKLSQRRSSLVKNNREYQFPVSRYSWLSV